MDGFDLHILVLKDPEETTIDNDSLVKGLVIFNQESQSTKLPNGKTAIKVVIHHFSAVEKINREVIFERALEFIWKNMHCSVIRINLNHITNKET
jgi:hypothetical protein